MKEAGLNTFPTWCTAGLTVLLVLVGSATLAAQTTTFQLVVSVNFESNMRKIAGSDAPFYYEPTGTAIIELRLVFDSAGGKVLSSEGMARITRFEGQGPHCTMRVPDGLIGAKVPVSFKEITWEPGGFMVFSGGMTYDNPSFGLTVSCPPVTAPVEDYPFYKALGVFEEKLSSLAIKPGKTDFRAENILWGMNDFMQSDLEGVLEETR